jgi:hypothetical protein
MKKPEQMEKFYELLVKECDEVFETYRLSDETRLIYSEHDMEL